MKVRNQDRPLLIEKQKGFLSTEKLPDIWRAAENLISSNITDQIKALNFLEEMDIIRYSPLLVHLTCSRIYDKTSAIRYRATELILSLLSPDEFDQTTPKEVSKELFSTLSKISQSALVTILQTSNDYPDMRYGISKLINYCPEAGNFLSLILCDRKQDIDIRRQAVDFIGLVGYVDTISTLLRIKSRIESRSNTISENQGFSNSLDSENTLLHSINTALTLLNTP